MWHRRRQMRDSMAGVIAGLLFGLGLCLSGMADPAVVLGFLDVAGDWNPALLFVMAGGVIVTFVGYRIVLGRARPLWSDAFRLPMAAEIDAPLISGAVLFGIGWGLSGYCPGPALVSLSSRRGDVVLFVLAILAGMMAVRWLRARPQAAAGKRPLAGGA
jgi:uncharacterized membrane protein YedE/YeeE